MNRALTSSAGVVSPRTHLPGAVGGLGLLDAEAAIDAGCEPAAETRVRGFAQ